MLNTTKTPPRQQNNNQKWAQAMERYKLPAGGIEVSVGNNTTKLSTVSAVTASSAADFPKTQMPPKAPSVVSAPRKLRPVNYLVTRALILVGALAAFGNIPVHSKVYFDGEQTPDLSAEARMALMDAREPQALALPSAEETETYAGFAAEVLPSAANGAWNLHAIAGGDSLENIIEPLKVNTSVADLTADEEVRKTLADLKATNKLLIQVDNQAIKQLIYATGKRSAYIVSLQDGKYIGKWDSTLFEEQNSRIAFTIRNPFHYEANKAGLPTSVTLQLSKIFKGDVNFRRIAIGDQISVIFEDYYYQSERIFTNDILAAEFNHRGEIHQRIRFAMADNKVRYLAPDSDLELKQVAFSRYPLKGGRLSSGFGSRRHPVFGYRRMHTGTDFAAPRGTPIYATGDGTVSYVGRKGGYGKAIQLRHFDGISTLYGHMSDYEKGLSSGSKVKRGDIIGYVGSTGTSTGNHVHYEFQIGGKQYNPMTVALPQTGILSAAEMRDFKNYARSMTSQLLRLRDTAAIDRNVDQQFGG